MKRNKDFILFFIILVVGITILSAYYACYKPVEFVEATAEYHVLPIRATVTPAAREPVSEQPEPLTQEYTITAYCPCQTCCGKYALNRPNGIVYGARGIRLQQGISMASALPFGTIVRIQGLGEYDGVFVCDDRPAKWIIQKYDSKIIDLYFETHEQAVEFGKRTGKVTILEVNQ